MGVSTVFGNATLDVTDSITKVLAGQLSTSDSRPLTVVRGSGRPLAETAGAHDPTGGASARTALAQALEAGPLAILALGPLTNLATLLRDRPDLRDNVMRIVAVVGRRRGHLFHPVEGGTAPSVFGHGPVFRDFNFAKDPEAAIALLDMRLPLTLVPYEAARDVNLTGAAR